MSTFFYGWRQCQPTSMSALYVLKNDTLQQCTINTKFLQPGATLPVAEPSGESMPAWPFRSGSYYKKSNTVDAKSWRAWAVLVFVESCSTNTNARCPREYTASEQQAHPNSPERLNQLSPTHLAIDGFPQDVHSVQFSIKSTISMDLVNQSIGLATPI